MIPFRIKEMAVYHGQKVRDNALYVAHFRKRGKEVEHFLRDVIGRDKRYLIDPEKENSLTMAEAAARRVLEQADVPGSGLDMIVFSSLLAEYAAPPSAVHLHHALGGSDACLCFDMNANCAGMSLALDLAGKYLASTPQASRALVVGSDYLNLAVDRENEYTYGHFGDGACALLLEKGDGSAGLLDSAYWTNSAEHNNILFPRQGFSRLNGDPHQFQIQWKPFDATPSVQSAVHDIRMVLERNGLDVADVSMFCLSQFVYRNIGLIREALAIPEAKSIYIGGEYGYTGTSSPFIALFEAVRRRQVRRGDYVVVWTVGAGAQGVTLLLRY